MGVPHRSSCPKIAEKQVWQAFGGGAEAYPSMLKILRGPCVLALGHHDLSQISQLVLTTCFGPCKVSFWNDAVVCHICRFPGFHLDEAFSPVGGRAPWAVIWV